jgi:uncharacterized membrane protein
MTHPSLARAQQLRAQRPGLGDPRGLDVIEVHEQQLTRGDRAADVFARTVGSWRFIAVQSAALLIWVLLNATGAVVTAWDPYPFILLNLALSFQAAYAAPILMMSQNRTADLDRTAAKVDYAVNQKAENEIEEILSLLRAQVEMTETLREEVTSLRQRLA